MRPPLPAPHLPLALLGGLSPAEFLRDYWHKKPLLIRQAMPAFQGLLPAKTLTQLAQRDDVESRLVYRDRQQQWQLKHGPLSTRDLARKGSWTVLVQGLNWLLDEADALLRQFAFVPYARLDDLMVSYATDGGGVGPHFDSYDVFLLQGSGQRLWQISAPPSQAVGAQPFTEDTYQLDESAPLRILREFSPTEEWTLDPGDMLYLPPHYAHNGVAVGDCTTYSIGFRAPKHDEILRHFLYYQEDIITARGRYADPNLQATTTPAAIDDAMIDQIANVIATLQWRRHDIVNFLGEFLTEQKPHVMTHPPENPIESLAKFKAAAKTSGLALSPEVQLLYYEDDFFLNGSRFDPQTAIKPLIKQFADARFLTASEIPTSAAWTELHLLHLDGYVRIVGQ